MFGDQPITVSEFISFLNQTLEFAYPLVSIVGELANLRVSKNKWLHFDLMDEDGSSLKFFGTVYHLKQPLEDGMLIKVSCAPRLHSNYGFSMQVQSIELVGEGSLKRAAEILQLKLAKEGLFDDSRKRTLTYPPTKIGLITSGQSAAYADFIKIINARWRGIEINLIDVQVQGEPAVEQIIYAINHFNSSKQDVEVLVLIRGGGSPEDLAAFNSEELTRAVAASKIPTLVAIGHEIDVSLAELASDKRASTPSNAAELLVPDRRIVLDQLKQSRSYISRLTKELIAATKDGLKLNAAAVHDLALSAIETQLKELKSAKLLLNAYNPIAVLRRGYSIVRKANTVLTSAEGVKTDDILDIRLASGNLSAVVSKVKLQGTK
jgi:exodeoxyribonuclease VII large subunit